MDTVVDELRQLLASYTEPCVGDCDHSQCPLLRELHALAISNVLEQARQTVKPVVDAERKGEEVGDLMNMRLRAPSPVAATVDAETKLRAALEDIASQRLRGEIDSIDGEVSGDFEGAYDIMINVAREAIADDKSARKLTLSELQALPICVKCNHPDDTNEKGICQTQIGARNWAYCLCRCVFPPSLVAVTVDAETPWRDEGGHAWEVRRNVTCVECPHCCFTFAAIHTVEPKDYDCPNCEGCPDAATPTSTEDKQT